MFETPQEHRQAFVDLAFPHSIKKLSGRGLYRLIGPDKDDPDNHREQIFRHGVEWLVREEVPDDLHLYISPTLRTASGYPAKKAGTVAAAVLWADIDADRGLDVHEAIGLAEEAGIPPTAVVRSGAVGHKGHIYWSLEAPFFIKEDLATFERMLKRLQMWLGGDPNVAQAAAVMRCPGTWNVKPKYGAPPPMCRFVELNKDRVYSWNQLEAAVPALPSRPVAKKKRSRGKAATQDRAPLETSAAELGRRLGACDFVTYCDEQASTLSEGLWVDLLWNLKDLGPAGEQLALKYSRAHPDFSEAETLKKLRYANSQRYSARCRKIVEDGFACPKYDSQSGRCAVFPAGAPADLVLQEERDVWVLDRRTFRRGRAGDKCIAEFMTRFDEERKTPDGATLAGRVLSSDGRACTFRIGAEVLGDPRALSRAYASVLGASFICDRRYLEQAVRVWLLESRAEIVTTELSYDFGLATDGDRFIDSVESIPPSAMVFECPREVAARRLGLGQRLTSAAEAQLASQLFADWPALNGPAPVEFLLGTVAWALVAPVMETLPEVPSLMAWLIGASGQGKSTHAVTAQAFFGDFHKEEDLVPFGSSALGVEDEGYFFRGALMVLDDVKQKTLERVGVAAFTDFIQRASGRARRSKMDRQGRPNPGRPFRGTLLLVGEDLVLRETSSLARVLTFEIPPKTEDTARLRRVLRMAPRLSSLTRSFVLWLVDQEDWKARVVARLEHHLDVLRGSVEGGANGIRISKSAAAVLTGLELWISWLDQVGVAHPLSVGHLAGEILGHAREQMATIDEATPGEHFLGLLRLGFEAGRLRLEGDDRPGVMVGRAVVDADGEEMVCVMYRAAIQQLRTLLEDGESLPPMRSIRKSLEVAGALGGCNPGRGTRAVRVDGKKTSTWPIRRRFLFPEEVE